MRSFKEGDSDMTRIAILQLEEYFAGERKEFSLPLRLPAVISAKVWNALVDDTFR